MNVPVEILVHIFKFISHRDRASAALTCQLWRLAVNDFTFKKKQYILVSKYTFHNKYFRDYIFKSQIVHGVPTFKFEQVEIQMVPESFWTINGPHIKELHFSECEVSEKMFLNILSMCPNLSSLAVQNCKELFMSVSLLEDYKETTENFGNNLICLDLSGNRYLTDALLCRFMKTVTGLKKLNVSDCYITFHQGLQRKFYPNLDEIDIDNITPSECILTFPFIKRFMELKGHCIDQLYLNITLIDGVALKSLMGMPNMKLKTLSLHRCDQLNNVGFQSICDNQKTLINLNLSQCNKINDKYLKLICENLTNLMILNLASCVNITNAGISEFVRLKNLKNLNISQCNQITSYGIINGLCKMENSQLEVLNLCALRLEDTAIELVTETFPKLINLNLNFCITAVNDYCVQAIAKNLKYLKILTIKHCESVTDAGCTGMGEGKCPTDKLKEIAGCSTILPDKYHRISLRSRAEEDIVKDAYRKKEVQNMCEQFNEGMLTGYSLVRLNNLEELDLTVCGRVSDVSFMHAFAFQSLKRLYMMDLQQVTYKGMEALTKNCPSIEVLEMACCYMICDKAVKIIAMNLKRLRDLDLRACNLLTNDSIHYIIKYCKSLRHLDVRTCRNIDVEVAEKVQEIPTLISLMLSKPGPYILDGKIPPPPIR